MRNMCEQRIMMCNCIYYIDNNVAFLSLNSLTCTTMAIHKTFVFLEEQKLKYILHTD